MFGFVFKQKTAYKMRISDWSSDVCSSDLYLYGDSLPPGPRAFPFEDREAEHGEGLRDHDDDAEAGHLRRKTRDDREARGDPAEIAERDQLDQRRVRRLL